MAAPTSQKFWMNWRAAMKLMRRGATPTSAAMRAAVSGNGVNPAAAAAQKLCQSEPGCTVSDVRSTVTFPLARLEVGGRTRRHSGDGIGQASRTDRHIHSPRASAAEQAGAARGLIHL